jgi:GNAT superfamily N-acetyltransferase
MSLVQTVGEVLEGIQNAKAGASDFRTNFFPVQAKLQAWIAHGELLSVAREGVSFFFRKDRDFWHFFFCTASPKALERGAATLPELRTERLVANLVGSESALGDLLPLLQCVGFRPYARLQRMARAAWQGRAPLGNDDAQVVCAEKSDCAAILGLIEAAFDRYAEQPPMLYEVESAVGQQQVLAVKSDGNIAGLLFFETQGVASTVRFWVVSETFRALRVGSALMMHYLNTQSAVRRFTLWVNAGNKNAIQKYEHFGYAPDGLVDHVLANQMVPA